MLKEALQALEQQYPEGLRGDIHYLAGLINNTDEYRRQEIRSTIRMWEHNVQRGSYNDEEVKALIAQLQELLQQSEPIKPQQAPATEPAANQ